MLTFRKHKALFFTAFVALMLLFVAGVSWASTKKPTVAPGDVLVVLKRPKSSGSSTISAKEEKARIKSLAASSGAEVLKTYSALSEAAGYSFALLHSNTKSETALLKELSKNPQVLGASLNYRIQAFDTPHDPQYSQLWGMHAISADKLWNNGITGGSEVYVAVLDTGLAYTHEDLAANFETKGYSRNFTDESSYSDVRGHGSHVAGTIAAVGNNGLGVVGVNWKAKIITLKVLGDDGSGYVSWTTDALNYLCTLIDQHPEMNLASVNLSLGGWQSKSPEEMISGNDPSYLAYKAVSDKNKAVICVAAGNESCEVGKPVSGRYVYPASYRNIANMIVVANAQNDSTYSKSSSSNYSTTYVDVAAPGANIYSTIPGNQYGTKSGTSMATPHVAGVAALLRSAFPTATAAQIKTAINSGANGNYAKSYTVNGFLDAKKAYDVLRGMIPQNTKPVILTSSLSDGYVGAPYSFQLLALGKTPITWTVSSGSLTNGLKLAKSTGKITGTPSKAGTFSFKVKATNTKGNATKTLKIKVITPAKLSITTSSLVSGTIGTAYNAQLTATGGVNPYSWSISSGKLPGGLTLNASTGVISGTPTKIETRSFTVKVKDPRAKTATKSLTLKINALPLTISYSFKSGSVGTYYSDYISVGNATAPCTWTVTSGSLPKGLSKFASGNYLYLSGVPTKAGTYNFTLKVKDKNGSIASRSFTLTISPMSISYTFGSGTVGAYYSNYIYVSGGVAGYSWKVTSGSLPKGLAMTPSGNYLYLAGVPTKAGSYNFTLKVTDKNGSTATKSFSMSISSMSINWTFSSGVLGAYYSSYVSVSGGAAAYSWKVSGGSLPKGLSMTPSGNYLYLTGIPTKAGSYSFTLKVTDKNGSTATKSFSITIATMTINWSFRNGTEGSSYSDYISVSNGVAPYSWTVSSGSLPNGLAMSPSGSYLYLKGTPTKAGYYDFTLKVTDGNGYSATKSFSVYIASSSSNGKSDNLMLHDGDTTLTPIADLKVDSRDVVREGTDADTGLVEVKANLPLRFVLGEWLGFDGSPLSVSDVTVMIDDKPAEGITVSDEGTFTIPKKLVHGDFKVYVKALHEGDELESETLYIISQ